MKDMVLVLDIVLLICIRHCQKLCNFTIVWGNKSLRIETATSDPLLFHSSDHDPYFGVITFTRAVPSIPSFIILFSEKKEERRTVVQL